MQKGVLTKLRQTEMLSAACDFMHETFIAVAMLI
jgi:hypothetical protein